MYKLNEFRKHEIYWKNRVLLYDVILLPIDQLIRLNILIAFLTCVL